MCLMVVDREHTSSNLLKTSVFVGCIALLDSVLIDFVMFNLISSSRNLNLWLIDINGRCLL